MTVLGSSLVSSLSGTAQTERQAVADAKKQERARPRDDKQRATASGDDIVITAQAADAVRRLASNDQEEATEDHAESPVYTSRGAKPRNVSAIDLSA